MRAPRTVSARLCTAALLLSCSVACGSEGAVVDAGATDGSLLDAGRSDSSVADSQPPTRDGDGHVLPDAPPPLDAAVSDDARSEPRPIDATAVDGADAAPDEARIVLGAGVEAFEPLPDAGGTLELEAGSQGGFHVFVSLELHGVDVHDLPLSYAVVDVETGERVSLPYDVLLTEDRVVEEGDHWVRLGDRLVLDVVEPVEVVDRLFDVEAEAEAPTGTYVDVRRITIVDER